MKARRRWVLPVYTAVIVVLILLPVAVMIAFGFNDPRGRFNLTWQGFSLRWYRHLFEVPDLSNALKASLAVAGISCVAATAMGTAMAYALVRRRFRGRGATKLILFLPMATPEIVMGASLLSMFVTLNLARGFATILAAHVMFSISYVVVTVRARLVGLDASTEEAARDLGATGWTAFRTVTLPLIFPGVLAAATLAFALSIDDFVVTSFIAGRTVTFPLWVYGASRFGVPPQVNAMGTLLFAVGVAAALIALRLQKARGAATRPL
jgi:spermidine/putrescine transport system permease protein